MSASSSVLERLDILSHIMKKYVHISASVINSWESGDLYVYACI